MSTFNYGCYNGDEDVLKVPPVFWILTDFRSAPNLDKTVLLKKLLEVQTVSGLQKHVASVRQHLGSRFGSLQDSSTKCR